jgi:hypothetical protein
MGVGGLDPDICFSSQRRDIARNQGWGFGRQLKARAGAGGASPAPTRWKQRKNAAEPREMRREKKKRAQPKQGPLD